MFQRVSTAPFPNKTQRTVRVQTHSMEHTIQLLRTTIATMQQDEVAFIYVPKERVDVNIFKVRFGPWSEVDGKGVTYALTREKLELCFGRKTRDVTAQIDWVLNIPPFASRNITSVAITADTIHSDTDHIVATFVPDQGEATTGATVLHFVDSETEWFKRIIGE